MFSSLNNHVSNNSHYHRYGGRGILICDEWINNFKNFYDWAMENGYSDDLSIDRIDYDGNYEPSNCRWVDSLTQANNTSRNIYITCGFYTFSISIWCRITGLTYDEISRRKNDGWSPEDIICTPPHTKRGEALPRIIVIPEKFMKLNKYNDFHKKKSA